MSYFLCGQTGNVNRGCEAILRSTVKVLQKRNGDIYLATFSPEQDRAMVRQLGIHMIPYEKYPTPLHRYACSAWRKLFRRSVAGTGYMARGLYAHMQPGDLSLNIGGDTYCYGRPLYSIALNRHTQKEKIDNILWCCSIEKEAIRGEIKEDLLRYRYIFAREEITRQNLLECGIPREKIVKVCDPAFFLDEKEVPLPVGFAPGNTVGLNVSECVVGKAGDMVYENVLHMARYILQETDMSICLIPHVYSIEKNICDWPILSQIKQDLGSERVSMVDREYDCEQLKYIISRCRFMVCARTHASIAAYSARVPTLVLGYSIKSKGIALDLFGSYENYVLSYQSLTGQQELTEGFRFLQSHEEEIRERLRLRLPEYKQQLTQAVSRYIHCPRDRAEICDRTLCSGCGACALACPKGCISMEEDAEGFLRPVIREEVCIHCGKCRNICPVANQRADNGKIPKTFAAIHREEALREESSSGGLFSAFAERTLAAGGVVFGAAFDENLTLVHTHTQTREGLAQFRGSKYVQSRIGDAYVRAEEFLEAGRQVLFSGTPCQIGGLHAYLGREYDNLLTLDVVCHGVPSPKIWRKYVKFREKEAGAKTQRVCFRNKEKGWKLFSMVFHFSNGEKYSRVLTEDAYLQGFHSHNFLRPACHGCSFKNVNRQSDITLADFWGAERLYPEKNDDRGISLVLLYSSRGEQAFAEIQGQVDSWETEYQAALRDNCSAVESCAPSKLRTAFLKDAERLEMDKLIKKYCGKGYAARARRLWARIAR